MKFNVGDKVRAKDSSMLIYRVSCSGHICAASANNEYVVLFVNGMMLTCKENELEVKPL